MNHLYVKLGLCQLAALYKIWNDEANYLEAKFGPYKLYSRSFRTLGEDQDVSDEVS